MRTNVLLLLSFVALVFASCSKTPYAAFQKVQDMEMAKSGPQYEQTEALAAAETVEMKEAATLATVDAQNELMVIEPANVALTTPAKQSGSLGKVAATKNSRKVATADKSVEKDRNIEFKGSLMASLANKLYDAVDAKRMESGKYAAMSTADIFAIVALVSGILALISYWGFFLFAVSGIVFGVLALNRGTSRRGMAIAGIALGAVAFFLWLVLFLFVVSAFAII